jgi:hypothetical protein
MNVPIIRPQRTGEEGRHGASPYKCERTPVDGQCIKYERDPNGQLRPEPCASYCSDCKYFFEKGVPSSCTPTVIIEARGPLVFATDFLDEPHEGAPQFGVTYLRERLGQF